MPQHNTPQLRFPEFSGAWSNDLMDNIATFSKGKNISKADIVTDGEIECIRYGELYTDYDVVINNIISKTNLKGTDLVFSKNNDIIIPSSGETQLDIAKASCVLKDNVALGGDLNIIRTENDGVFMAYSLNEKKKFEIAAMAQGNSVVHLYSSQLKALSVNFPTLPEQQKIASFLSAADKKLEQLQQKKTLLEQYKKGMMQKLFSQQIRFKDDEGKDFPEWEEKELGDLYNITSSKRVFQNEWTNSGVPFFRAREIVKLSENGFVENELFISNKMYEDYKEKYGVPKKDDLLVTGVGTIGILYVVRDGERFYFKDGNIIWFKTAKKANSQFVKFLFQTRIIRTQIENNASITTVGTYTIDSAKKTKIPFPSLAEQAKIADFLTAIDAKIAAVNAQVAAAKGFKKGLLQQMFV